MITVFIVLLFFFCRLRSTNTGDVVVGYGGYVCSTVSSTPRAHETTNEQHALTLSTLVRRPFLDPCPRCWRRPVLCADCRRHRVAGAAATAAAATADRARSCARARRPSGRWWSDYIVAVGAKHRTAALVVVVTIVVLFRSNGSPPVPRPSARPGPPSTIRFDASLSSGDRARAVRVSLPTHFLRILLNGRAIHTKDRLFAVGCSAGYPYHGYLPSADNRDPYALAGEGVSRGREFYGVESTILGHLYMI